MSNFIYEYIRIFVRVEIFTNVTLCVGNSGESGSIGEFGASEIYDDSFKLGVLESIDFDDSGQSTGSGDSNELGDFFL